MGVQKSHLSLKILKETRRLSICRPRYEHATCIILWHVDPLLDNDPEISSYAIAVAKKWLSKQRTLLDNGRNRHARNNRRTARIGNLCAVRAEAIYRGPAAIREVLRQQLEE
jgi:hypothetical protein